MTSRPVRDVRMEFVVAVLRRGGAIYFEGRWFVTKAKLSIVDRIEAFLFRELYLRNIAMYY
jgi:hypothetical protein